MRAEIQTVWRKDGFAISTDKSHLDEDRIFDYLSRHSYWAAGIPRRVVTKAIAHTALCFGLYDGDPSAGRASQIGLARVISDLATFAYLADVFIVPEYRGRGLAKWLMQVILAHPDLRGLRRFLLATQDAHGLYGRFGFAPLGYPDRWMEIARGLSVYQSPPPDAEFSEGE